MTSDVRISTALLEVIAAEAGASPTREVCGLLFGTAHAITARRSARNVAADPRTAFEIDPAALLAAHREQRGGGPAIVGCYHSHPSGAPAPSPRDAANARADGLLWLIVAVGEARLWRATATGDRHGRFDPVTLTCIDAPPSPEDPVRR
ncbi:M67 family metallopeptidase [uncultured Sphingomonas sp.]|uniref:M67 family metallopeptidase n=1 Tax=uncultured Sphingomonas sp. TaxID=158754 RepID=UPI0035CC8525